MRDDPGQAATGARSGVGVACAAGAWAGASGSARANRSTLVCAAGLSFNAVCVRNTPPPKPKASAPITVPTPSRYELKESGMLASIVHKANARIAAEVPAISTFDENQKSPGPPQREFCQGSRRRAAWSTRGAHPITSSARTGIEAGTARSSALVVFRLRPDVRRPDWNHRGPFSLSVHCRTPSPPASDE